MRLRDKLRNIEEGQNPKAKRGRSRNSSLWSGTAGLRLRSGNARCLRKLNVLRPWQQSTDSTRDSRSLFRRLGQSVAHLTKSHMTVHTCTWRPAASIVLLSSPFLFPAFSPVSPVAFVSIFVSVFSGSRLPLRSQYDCMTSYPRSFSHHTLLIRVYTGGLPSAASILVQRPFRSAASLLNAAG